MRPCPPPPARAPRPPSASATRSSPPPSGSSRARASPPSPTGASRRGRRVAVLDHLALRRQGGHPRRPRCAGPRAARSPASARSPTASAAPTSTPRHGPRSSPTGCVEQVTGERDRRGRAVPPPDRAARLAGGAGGAPRLGAEPAGARRARARASPTLTPELDTRLIAAALDGLRLSVMSAGGHGPRVAAARRPPPAAARCLADGRARSTVRGMARLGRPTDRRVPALRPGLRDLGGGYARPRLRPRSSPTRAGCPPRRPRPARTAAPRPAAPASRPSARRSGCRRHGRRGPPPG